MNFKEAIQANRQAVLDLTTPELRQILPTLYDIREQTAKELFTFLKKNKGDEKYSAHKHRALLGQLDDVIKVAEKELPKSALKELKTESGKATKTSVRNLQSMINTGEARFRESVTPLRLPVAKIINRESKILFDRHKSLTGKYGAEVSRKLRNDLMIGVVKGESISQMAHRLTGGRYEKLAKKGNGAVAEAIATGQYEGSYHDAVRIARTELNYAYNDAQVEGLRQANNDDPGWKKKWDAANDDNVCDDCDALDGEVVDVDDDFSGGVSGPPLHPNDRCSVIPWREDWPDKL